MHEQEMLVLLTRLRACYPQRVSDADHWAAMTRRYGEELSAFPDAVVSNALAIAWRQFPQFFPSLGELADFCSAVAKRRAMASTVKRLPEASAALVQVQPHVPPQRVGLSRMQARLVYARRVALQDARPCVAAAD